jgi:hypothetical protein
MPKREKCNCTYYTAQTACKINKTQTFDEVLKIYPQTTRCDINKLKLCKSHINIDSTFLWSSVLDSKYFDFLYTLNSDLLSQKDKDMIMNNCLHLFKNYDVFLSFYKKTTITEQSVLKICKLIRTCEINCLDTIVYLINCKYKFTDKCIKALICKKSSKFHIVNYLKNEVLLTYLSKCDVSQIPNFTNEFLQLLKSFGKIYIPIMKNINAKFTNDSISLIVRGFDEHFYEYFFNNFEQVNSETFLQLLTVSNCLKIDFIEKTFNDNLNKIVMSEEFFNFQSKIIINKTFEHFGHINDEIVINNALKYYKLSNIFQYYLDCGYIVSMNVLTHLFKNQFFKYGAIQLSKIIPDYNKKYDEIYLICQNNNSFPFVEIVPNMRDELKACIYSMSIVKIQDFIDKHNIDLDDDLFAKSLSYATNENHIKFFTDKGVRPTKQVMLNLMTLQKWSLVQKLFNEWY